ncbi:MAG: hypothetical protein N2234_09930, partial [Planctomycetota bacterium]|nr:hypothetical protein [Planctomycetota bacterium]
YAYSIESGEWYRLSQSGAPAARSGHRAVWCDKYLLIWGGWVEKEGGGGASSPAQEVIRLGNGGILEP